jgi:hypothetical protein
VLKIAEKNAYIDIASRSYEAMALLLVSRRFGECMDVKRIDAGCRSFSLILL